MQNDLSQMNISHMTKPEVSPTQRATKVSPGMIIENSTAMILFNFITNKDAEGLLRFL